MGIFNFRNSYKYEPQKVNKKLKKIIESSKYDIIPSVDDYINALNSAKSKVLQSRTKLYDHYTTTLELDYIVNALLNKRYSNIKNKSLIIKDNEGGIYDDLNYFLTAPKFKNFIIDILSTKFWGFNVFEFDYIVNNDKNYFDYFLFPHKHINPFRREVLETQWASAGTSFKNKKDVLMLGDANDMGLLSQITLLSIYRRYGMFNYSRYAELASENFTTIKTRGFTTDENMNRISESYLERGKGGVMEIPEGVDVESETQSSSQQNTLFENYQKMLKEELSIIILGQTMTTFDGSSRSQAEVHSTEQQSIFSDDEEYILNALNYEFKKYINIWFPDLDTNNIEFDFRPNTDLELKEKLEEYKILKELGINFSEDELREKFKDIL